MDSPNEVYYARFNSDLDRAESPNDGDATYTDDNLLLRTFSVKAQLGDIVVTPRGEIIACFGHASGAIELSCVELEPNGEVVGSWMDISYVKSNGATASHFATYPALAAPRTTNNGLSNYVEIAWQDDYGAGTDSIEVVYTRATIA